MIFCSPEEAIASDTFRGTMERGTGFDDSLRYLSEHGPMFDNYETFLEACFREND